jgi:hypothetical protein
MENFEKKSILKFELKFEKKLALPRGKWKKLKYVTIIWNEKSWKFLFSNIEMKQFKIFVF